jgi:perosamine synthetase
MIEVSDRQAILQRGQERAPLSQGEPQLGSSYGKEEIEAAVQAMRDGQEVNRGFGFSGEPIPQFEQAFADYIGTKHAIAVNSAGPGLDMAMRYLELQPGDEVIVPAVNFVASPLAVIGAGGQIIWGEVDPRTFELDLDDVEKKISPRTRAIFPVHMNGLAAPMDELIEIGKRHPHDKHGPIAVIGDGARALGGGYKDTKIGKKGLVEVFSLHTMKNMTTLGEGGMIVTDDDEVQAFCRDQRFYGLSNGIWGTSNVLTTVQAAVGLVQLGKLDGFIRNRRRLAQQRHELLAGVPELTLPCEPDDCEHSYYLYTVLIDESWAGEKRDQIIVMMKEKFGVGCVVANAPVYWGHKLLREHTAGQSLPVSEALGKRLFCVSIHPSMSEEDNEYVAAALIECIERLR